jgi:hypothetical protein
MCFSVFVLSCVQVAALRLADPPSKESYLHQETEKAAKAQKNSFRAIDRLIFASFNIKVDICNQ